MELFCKSSYWLKAAVFQKSSTIDVWLSSKHSSESGANQQPKAYQKPQWKQQNNAFDILEH